MNTMNVEFKDGNGVGENPILKEAVTKDSEVKEWLVNYVGDKHDPKNDEVTVEMIIETMGKEFPEFLLALAEENWVRGYQQALVDVDEGQKLMEAEQSGEEQQD
jgi:hypothetical protein